MIRVAINGFGRIGRQVLRAWLEGKHPDIDLVAINDPSDINLLAHLLRYDSVHGALSNKVHVVDETLHVGEHALTCSHERDPASCAWGDLGIDVVLECSGFFSNRQASQGHRQAGAKHVLISAPAGQDVDSTVVYGVNHQHLTRAHHIVSNASCTTNALAPMLDPLHQAFGVVEGLMTTVHAYTGDQRLLDTAHKDYRRARSAPLSMIPTQTGAAAAIGLVIPELTGRLDGFAIRVPTPNVSVIDLTVRFEKTPSREAIHDCLQAAAAGPLAGVLALNTQPLVSIDFNHHPASSIVDLDQTRQCGSLYKLLAWYDNEWGFSHRMLDVVSHWLK